MNMSRNKAAARLLTIEAKKAKLYALPKLGSLMLTSPVHTSFEV